MNKVLPVLMTNVMKISQVLQVLIINMMMDQVLQVPSVNLNKIPPRSTNYLNILNIFILGSYRIYYFFHCAIIFRKTIQSADKAGNMDDKSSANELIKSTDKNANKTSEIENAQLVRYTLDRSENDGWRDILNASVSENLHCDICMEIFIKV